MSCQLQEPLLQGVTQDMQPFTENCNPEAELDALVKYIQSLRGKGFEEAHEQEMEKNLNFACLNSICSWNDGRKLAFGMQKTIRIWDSLICKEVFSIPTYSKCVTSICVSPDEEFLSYGSEEKIIRILSLREKQIVATLKGHLDSVKAIEFSPDSKRLASGSCDGTIKVWDLKKMREEFTLRGHSKTVNCISFSKDGLMLASGSEDWKVKIWDLRYKTEKASLNEHYKGVNCLCFYDDMKLASGGKDKMIVFWDLNSFVKESVKKENGEVNSIKMIESKESDGEIKILACGFDDGMVKILSINDWSEIRKFTLNDQVHSLCYLIKDRIAAFTEKFRVETMSLCWKYTKDYFYLQGHSDLIISVAFSPDGRFLVSGSLDETIKIWNFEERKEIFTLNDLKNSPSSVCVSPDGKFFGYAKYNKFYIWSIEEQKEFFKVKAHSD